MWTRVPLVCHQDSLKGSDLDRGRGAALLRIQACVQVRSLKAGNKRVEAALEESRARELAAAASAEAMRAQLDALISPGSAGLEGAPSGATSAEKKVLGQATWEESKERHAQRSSVQLPRIVRPRPSASHPLHSQATCACSTGLFWACHMHADQTLHQPFFRTIQTMPDRYTGWLLSGSYGVCNRGSGAMHAGMLADSSDALGCLN